jgi:hypothetical protein
MKHTDKNAHSNTKSFAFQLAAKQGKTDTQRAPWQIRDGVSVAGCSGPDARASKYPGRDNGIYC